MLVADHRIAATLEFPPVPSRRQFLLEAPLGLAATLAACTDAGKQSPAGTPATGAAATPGAPPAFNTAPPVGPEVTPATFAEA